MTMNISYAETPGLYTSALSCHEYLSKIDYSSYEYPSTVQLFHVFSDIKNEVQALTLKSFIKTQKSDCVSLVRMVDSGPSL